MHLRGWDVGTNIELEVSINGAILGWLRKREPEAANEPSIGSVFWVEKKRLQPGTNRLEVRQTIPGNVWAVDQLQLLKPGAAFGNINKSTQFDDTAHKKGVDVHLRGRKAKLLTIRAWDNARTRGGEAEVQLTLNGKALGSTPRSGKNRLGPAYQVYLPKQKLGDDNIVFIRNRIKAGTNCGVQLNALSKGGAEAGRIGKALKGTKKRVDYLVPVDKNKNRKLLTKYNDVDTPTELKILVDGKFVTNAPTSENKKWVKDAVSPPAKGKARLAKVTVQSTKNKDRWGSAIRGWK